MKPIHKELTYIEMDWSAEGLLLSGDNKFVEGKILIRHRAYLYSILVFILRIFRQPRWTRQKKLKKS